MPKKAVQDIARQTRRQLGKFTGDVFETLKKQPGEMTDIFLEQLGVSSGSSSSGQPKKQASPGDGQTEIKRKELLDKMMAQKRIAEINAELKKWQALREEQLKRRREEAAQAQKPPVEESPFEISSKKKPKRGSLLLGRRGKKSETAGMKRSG